MDFADSFPSCDWFFSFHLKPKHQKFFICDRLYELERHLNSKFQKTTCYASQNRNGATTTYLLVMTRSCHAQNVRDLNTKGFSAKQKAISHPFQLVCFSPLGIEPRTLWCLRPSATVRCSANWAMVSLELGCSRQAAATYSTLRPGHVIGSRVTYPTKKIGAERIHSTSCVDETFVYIR